MTDDIEMDIPVSNGTAIALEANGMRIAKQQPPSVMSQQLRDELIRILQTGDSKNGGAFTVAIAAQVEKFVVAAREILMTENLAQNDLQSLMMMRRPRGPGVYLGGSPYDGSFDVGGGLLPPVNNENFGVQAVRQVVDAIRTIGESPAKLVEALAAARKNDLHDIAAVLEKKLGKSGPPTPTPPSDADSGGSVRSAWPMSEGPLQ